MFNLDRFISDFSQNITILRKLENESPNSPKHRFQFTNLLNILLKRKKFAQDQDLWKEMYIRSLVFYKHTTLLGNIPIILVTKHNHIIPFYMKHKIHQINDTLIHFDTHSDLNDIKNSSLLPRYYKLFLDTNEPSYIKNVQELVWDIGAAITSVLYTTGPKDFVWAIPSWLPDPQAHINYFLKHGKTNILLKTTSDISQIDNMEEFSSSKTNKERVSNTFTKIQTGMLTNNAFRTIRNMISKNGTKYILDVDLDYFVCNGKPVDKTYKKESFDVKSYYRSTFREVNQHLPRNVHENTSDLRKYKRELDHEVGEIKYRIKKFMRLLKDLKKYGLIPSHISISDSTNVEFYDCDNCNSVSNNYVPHNLALYVHTKVVSGLTKLFT